MGGAAVAYRAPIAPATALDIGGQSPVDPAFGSPGPDGKIRTDCSPSAMARPGRPQVPYAIAHQGNDADVDRHGIVTPSWVC